MSTKIFHHGRSSYVSCGYINPGDSGLGDFVFATDKSLLAAIFSHKTETDNKGKSLPVALGKIGSCFYVILCGRDYDIDKLNPGYIYTFRSDSFNKLYDFELDCGWYSKEKVPANICRIKNSPSMQNLMQINNVQIFTLPEDIDRYEYRAKFLTQKENIGLLATLRASEKEEMLIHENKRFGLSPLNLSTGLIEKSRSGNCTGTKSGASELGMGYVYS